MSSPAWHARLERARRIAAASPRGFVAIMLLVAVCAWGAAGWLAWLTVDVTRGLPKREDIAAIGNMVQATTLYDAGDKPVFAIFKEQRMEVPLSKISPNLVRALIAIEDQRFYEHSGVDLLRVAGAALSNLREGRRAQGGSTLTQQLAKQSFLTSDKTLRRKLRELILAAHIEHAYSKEEILELYLNKMYFGDGLYGAEAASLGFFGKHASELEIAEAALIAGLVKSPSTWAPTVNLERAVARRNLVLQAMLDTGAIDRATHDAARASRVRLTNALRRDEAFGLYFKEQVRRELIERFGWDRVYQGGLRVYTTIDPGLQKAAEDLTEKALRDIEARKGYRHPVRAAVTSRDPGGDRASTEYLQAALVAMDPATGAVRALIGGRRFADSHFNRATQAKRQAGSAFKPFLYAAALESGYTPASVIDRLDDPIATPQGAWVPEDEHSGASAMTLRTALRISSNRAAVQLLQAVGIPKTVQYVSKLNIGSLPGVPSLALGSGEVTLLSMTAGYATFANGGSVPKPMLIRRVEDTGGRVLYEETAKPQRAIESSTAFMIANMLADVINAGTAYRARAAGFNLPAAGKTGTTNDYHDAWFVGFTPQVLTGVWIGFDTPQTIVRNGYAGELAVPLWASFMKVATRGHEPGWLQRPRNVTGLEICRVSGKLPGSGCYIVDTVNRDGEAVQRSYVGTEYFLRGTEPDTGCDLHPLPVYRDLVASGARIESPPPAPIGASPAPSADAPAVASSTPTSGAAPADRPADPEKAEEEQPKKKRGFWARLFGRGRDDDDDDEKKKKEERRLKEEEEKRRRRKPPRQ
jgi:penicillin-binding protein 1A